MNRESWLKRGGEIICREIFSDVSVMPPWEVSCGWPSRRALSNRNRVMGECWYPDLCADKSTSHIFISPSIAEGIEALDTLAHELVHVAVGPKYKHGHVFKRMATSIGLAGPMTSTTAGPELRRKLEKIIERLGPYPHQALKGRLKPKQGTRMLKFVCKECGWVGRTTMQWAKRGLPTCACGGEMLLMGGEE